jgi:hypothetical protein
MTAMVAPPLGRLNSASTAACLDLLLGEATRVLTLIVARQSIRSSCATKRWKPGFWRRREASPTSSHGDLVQKGERLGVPVTVIDWKDHELARLGAGAGARILRERGLNFLSQGAG